MKTVSKTPPRSGGFFSAKAVIVDAESMRRSFRRIAHQISERNNGELDQIVLVGIKNGGVPVAHVLGEMLSEIGNVTVPVDEMDVSAHRDDVSDPPVVLESISDVAGKTVVLVDDVLYTGRTVRAALNTLLTYGRPENVQLAVVVDRGHREMPIHPDYVVKNLPTNRAEHVRVTLEGGIEIGKLEDI